MFPSFSKALRVAGPSVRMPFAKSSGRLFASPAAASVSASSSTAASVKDYVKSLPATKFTCLPNGIRVVTDENHGHTATVGVWWDAGSRYETEQTNGTAHFLEHMFFKGTPRRSRTQLEIEIENMGAHLNAYTSRETTTFYTKVLKEDVRQALDVLSDMMKNSVVSEDAIEQEKETILREAVEVAKNPTEVVFDYLHETAYRGTSLGRTILGSEDAIKNMKRDYLTDYRTQLLTGGRLVISGAGSVKHEDLVNYATEFFGDIPSKSPSQEPSFAPARFTGSDIRARYDDMNMLHVALAFPTAGVSDYDNVTLMVIQQLFGSYDASLSTSKYHLSELVSNFARNEHPLGTALSSFSTQYSDTGLFGIFTSCYATRAQHTMWYIMEELRRLSYDVCEEKVAQAKTTLIASMLSGLDGHSQVCEDSARQVLTLGRRMHPYESIARIEAVDVNAIRACAKRYFWDRDFALASYGPSWELPDYLWLRRRTYATRF